MRDDMLRVTHLTVTARYAISGELLKSLGWEPTTKLSERIIEFSQWMLDNPRWLDMELGTCGQVVSHSETASCLV